jgi:hypothetical protein
MLAAEAQAKTARASGAPEPRKLPMEDTRVELDVTSES